MPIYDPKAIANYFLDLASDITQMKLHKLIYYAHGWNLGLTDEPLIDEAVQAWGYGPVVPSVYYEFKDLGSTPIDRKACRLSLIGTSFIAPRIDADDEWTPRLLARIWKVYGAFTATQLSRLTHEPESPWSKTRERHPNLTGVDIPNDLIRDHFKQQLRSAPDD